MKKALVWILVLALLAVASVLGTIAYLTDEDYAENIMTIGNVDIELLEYERVDTETKDADAKVQEFRDNKPLLPAVIEKGFDYTPGDTYVDWTQSAVDWKQNGENGYTSPIWDPAKINNEVDKMVFVKNTGDYSAFVRTYFAFEAGSFETFDEFKKMIHLNLNADGGWKWEWLPFPAENADGDIYFIAKATYQKALAPDNFTDITLSQISLDYTATNADVDAFGDTYEVCVNTQAIQSDGFTDPKTALDENFGRDIPFENLKLVTGITLKTALHNLNGNGSTPITTKVTSVTFGLNKDHSDKVSGYEGTLTSDEQDVPVYTYYVENGSNYDLYVLADSAIYTPKDSTGLFQGMTSLTTVDTTNMDVSRTVNMKSMFMSCESLTSLDVSRWDVSNVEAMNMTFTYCKNLKELNVSGWNVGKVTTMSSMFYDCSSLESLNVTNWNVENVTNMQMLFYNCQKLKNINLSNWQVGNVTTMKHMFWHCEAIESLGVGGWNVSKVTTFERMFSSCHSIKSLDLNNWKTTSATNMAYMFYECKTMHTLNVSNFDLSDVTTIHGMFEKCFVLKELDVKAWDVSRVEDMIVTFRECDALKILDLSDWNTSNVKATTKMFQGDANLQTIYVGDGWDISHVEDQYIDTEDELSTRFMFEGCTSLKGSNNTTLISDGEGNAIVDKTYARVDNAPEAPGYLTYKAAPTTNP